MKIVVLFGSPRRSGFTSRLLEAFCSGLEKSDLIARFNAYEMNIKPCYHCGKCSKDWSCIHDDMDVLLNAIRECDTIVIASPVYYLSFPSQLKAIIDRMQRAYSAYTQGRSPFEGKIRQVILLLTAGSRHESGDVIIQQMRWLLPSLNAQLVGRVVMTDTDSGEVNSDVITLAKQLAHSIIR